MPESSLNSDRIYGKILLFGEYTVLLSGDALAIPLQIPSFSGSLQLGQNEPSDPVWKAWLKYLLSNKDQHFTELEFDWNRFDQEINAGLRFESGIPIGFGIGSSGALTAAVMKKYVPASRFETLRTDLSQLKYYLAQFESFFHGSSSGLDPLVSILNTPILISGGGTLSIPPMNREILSNWYIIDSGVTRQTSTLVEIFKKRIADNPTFVQKMQEMKRANYSAIQALLHQKKAELFTGIHHISSLQFEVLNWLIPENIKSLWEAGLKSDKFCFKLCGAGGGGFFLAYIPFEEDQGKISSLIQVHKLID